MLKAFQVYYTKLTNLFDNECDWGDFDHLINEYLNYLLTVCDTLVCKLKCSKTYRFAIKWDIRLVEFVLEYY